MTKEDRRIYLFDGCLERDLKTPVTFTCTQNPVPLTLPHNPDYILMMDSYININEKDGKTTVLSETGDEYPIATAKVFSDCLKRINSMLIEEYFNKNKALQALNRADYASDELYEQAIDAVDWEIDITQTFNFTT